MKKGFLTQASGSNGKCKNPADPPENKIGPDDGTGSGSKEPEKPRPAPPAPPQKAALSNITSDSATVHWQLGAVASENLNDSAPPNGTEDEKGSPTPRPGREPAGGQDEMNDEEEATGCERGMAVSPPQWRSSVVLVDETKKEAISEGESGDNKKDQDKGQDKTDKLVRVDGKWNSELFDGMGGFEAKLTGLKAGCKYSLFATTHADEGDVDGVAVSFSAAPSCPARPEEPVICGKGKNFVKLRWTVPSGRGSAVAQYEVEIRNSFQAGSPSAKGSRAKTQQEVGEEEIEMWGCGVQVHQGPETRCEIKGLRPGTSLQARVRAFNAIGASQPSAWITVTTAATVPLAPPCPFVGQANIGNLYFGWYEPADNGGATIQSYCLEIDEGNGEGFMIKYNGPDQQWLLKNAVCGHPYKVRVKATNEVGSSPCSEVCEAHGLCGPPSPPGPPELIDLPQGMSPSFAMCLRWAPPASDNGSCIQLYQVVMRRIVDGLAVEFFQVVYAGPDMRCQIQGLFPASCYEFGVVAVSLLGTSPPSLTSSFTTAGAPPPPPPPPFLLGIEGGDVNVGWTLPSVCNGSPVSSFVLESLVPHEDLIDEASGQAEWVSSVQYSGSGISYWIKGLNPGIPVWLRVAAVNGYGQGLFSAPVNIMTPCAAPGKVTKVSAIATGPGRACVRWEPPAKNGGMPIIAYKVWVSRKGVGGSDPIQLTVEGGGPAVVEGLVAGTLYQAKVQAMNSMGAGEFSEPFVFSSEAGSPSAPKMPVISHVTTDTIGVSWEKPEQDNGAPVEHFALEMQQTTATLSTESTPASKNPWRVVYKGSFTSFEVGGLEPGGSYRFRVRGRNAAGEGPFSPPVICCTEAVPPGPPLSVTVLSVSAKELKLKWSAPAFNGGSDITSYAVILESASVGEREVYRGEHTKCSVKVSPATVYNLRVIAHTVIGGGTPSIPLTFTTPATVAVGVKVRAPPAMPPPTFSVKGHGVFVSWAHCRDSQPPVVSYHLSAQPEHVSANGRGDTELDDCTPDAHICYSGAGTSTELCQLLPGVPYRLRLRAENEIGKGPWSPVTTCFLKSAGEKTALRSTRSGPPLRPSPTLVLDKATRHSLWMSWGGGGGEGKAARRLPAPQPDEKEKYKIEVAEEAGAFVVVADDVVQTQYRVRVTGYSEKRNAATWSTAAEGGFRTRPIDDLQEVRMGYAFMVGFASWLFYTVLMF